MESLKRVRCDLKYVVIKNTFILILFNLFVVLQGKSYNNGLIFYDLNTRRLFLPPAVSIIRNNNPESRNSMWSKFGPQCECDGPNCGCCVGLNVKQYKYNEKMCANVTFMPEDDEALVEVHLNERNAARYAVFLMDPDPMCLPLMMPIPMSMCIQMSQIGANGTNLHMCMDFVVLLHQTPMMQMHFNCMQMGTDGLQYLNPSGSPVFPPSQSKNVVNQGNQAVDWTKYVRVYR